MARQLFASVSVMVAVAVSALIGPLETALAAGTPCDPIQTAPHFRGEVPSPEQVLGYPIGSQEASAADITTYIAAVDAASPRVVSGQFATSWEGRPLKYAIVGRAGERHPGRPRRDSRERRGAAQPVHPDAQAATARRELPRDPLARRERPRERGVRRGRRPAHPLRACRP